jgi:predicted nucleic acid-binding protein
MSTYYFDTSALVKRYHPEAGHAWVMNIWEDASHRVLISRLCQTELHSAFALKVRGLRITSNDYDHYLDRFFDDVARKRPEIVRVLVRHFGLADELIIRHGKTHPLRTLDALQLAVALDLKRQNQIHTFVSADDRLNQIANLETLPTLNPLTA